MVFDVFSGDSEGNPQSESYKQQRDDTRERASRGKSAAPGAGESARYGLTPRSDTGSALPDNTRYLISIH